MEKRIKRGPNARRARIRAKKRERIESLKEAQDLLGRAILLIEGAIKNTTESEAYIIAHLWNWCYGNNVCTEATIPKLIEHFENDSE